MRWFILSCWIWDIVRPANWLFWPQILKVKTRVWQPFQRGEQRSSFIIFFVKDRVSMGGFGNGAGCLRSKTFADRSEIVILNEAHYQIVIRDTLVEKRKVVKAIFPLISLCGIHSFYVFLLTCLYARVKVPVPLNISISTVVHWRIFLY